MPFKTLIFFTLANEKSYQRFWGQIPSISSDQPHASFNNINKCKIKLNWRPWSVVYFIVPCEVYDSVRFVSQIVPKPMQERAPIN